MYSCTPKSSRRSRLSWYGVALASTLLLWGGALGAKADVLVYDDFASAPNAAHGAALPDVTLHGAQTGGGWAGGWLVQNDRTDVPGYTISHTTPLKFGKLQSRETYAAGGLAYLTAGRELDTAKALAPYADANGLIGKLGTTLWMSVLVRIEPGQGGPMRLSLHPNGATLAWMDNDFPLAIGTVAGDQFWGLSVNQRRPDGQLSAVFASSKIAVTPGQTVLLVLRLKFATDGDTASLFVNPQQLGGEPPTTPSAEIVLRDLKFRSVSYYGGNSVETSAIAAIRFGASFADVTPPSNSSALPPA